MTQVSAPSILSVGWPGQGKTYALATLAVDPAIEKLIYLFTDPGGDESLIDALRAYDVPISKVHWHYIPPAAQSWSSIEEMAKKVNSFDYESLASLKSGIDKKGHQQFYEMLSIFSDFTCQRTGKSLGPTDDFPENWAVAFDSLTGLNQMARELTVGAKPTMHQGEWGTAMELEGSFIRKFVSGISCPRVMIAHLDQQRDELTGRVSFMPALLGTKLAPKIPHLFSDMIYSYSEGGKFLWATMHDQIMLKSRNLPISSKLEPDYRPLIKKWQERKEYASTIDVVEETTNAA